MKVSLATWNCLRILHYCLFDSDKQLSDICTTKYRLTPKTLTLFYRAFFVEKLMPNNIVIHFCRHLCKGEKLVCVNKQEQYSCQQRSKLSVNCISYLTLFDWKYFFIPRLVCVKQRMYIRLSKWLLKCSGVEMVYKPPFKKCK